MRKNVLWMWISACGLGMVASLHLAPAYAQQSPIVFSGHNPRPTLPAFGDDASAPATVVPVTPPQSNTRPVSRRTDLRWQVYDQPIRECIQGNTIIPSNGQDIFAYLFHNQSAVDVNMSIQGWQKGKCLISFSEGSQVHSCQFERAMLKPLLDQVLNDSQFDANGQMAEVLNKVCS